MLPRLAAVLLLAAVAAPAVAAPDDKDIQDAIRRGQYYLKAIYRPGGMAGRPGAPPPPVGGFGDLNGGALLPFVGGNGFGSAALAGLALLESGVPATDPAVANIEHGLRASAFGTRATYEISLLIMFFDRLGRKEDTPMIQFLTIRLLSGQLRDGTWSYSCDGLVLNAVQERQIQAEIGQAPRIATPPPKKDPAKESRPRKDLDLPPPPKKDEPKPEPKKEEPKGLHPLLEKMVPQAGRGPASAFGTSGDHSNTQFATVGLWVGRRHHVPVSDALKLLDKHYRETVGPDGGWGYTGSGGVSSPSMTCAGLMGLAMGHGAKISTEGAKAPRGGADADALMADKVVAEGLKYIGQFLAAAANQRDPRGPGGLDGEFGFAPNELSNNLYFMWSLERVGMVYGLTTIGKVDWYEWGSKSLVKSQQRDGSWSDGGNHGTVDNATAFALLFLCRANLAQDLSATLKGKVKDPGTSRLQGGNVSDLIARAGSGSSPPKKPEASTTVKTPPTPKGDVVTELANALVKAKPAERATLLAKYRDTKGADYTDALVRALAELKGEALTETRDALAQRLTRMTPANLVGYMEDKNRELRRAAALACAAKGRDRMKEFADALIKRIGDDDSLVVQAARASLKELSGVDHGPDVAATVADRRGAAAAWGRWWEGQK